MGHVLILLPPSESKHAARRGRPLDLATLAAPALNPLRRQVLDALMDICRTDPATAMEALDLGPTQFDLVVQNAELDTAPTAPAARVYTGVLYAALDLGSLDRRKVNRRLAIVSALFGLVRPSDRIPAYRLSGGSRLPGIGPLPGFWRESVSAHVAASRGLVVDMLSSPYASMVALPRGAVSVKVWQPGPAGQRTAASHFNKATKGHLARALVAGEDVRTPQGLLDAVRAAGFHADLDGLRLDVMRVE